MKSPKIEICGERAVNSNAPLYVLGLDGRWKPGTGETRARAKQMIAKGYGYATWIYGIST